MISPRQDVANEIQSGAGRFADDAIVGASPISRARQSGQVSKFLTESSCIVFLDFFETDRAIRVGDSLTACSADHGVGRGRQQSPEELTEADCASAYGETLPVSVSARGKALRRSWLWSVGSGNRGRRGRLEQVRSTRLVRRNLELGRPTLAITRLRPAHVRLIGVRFWSILDLRMGLTSFLLKLTVQNLLSMRWNAFHSR